MKWLKFFLALLLLMPLLWPSAQVTIHLLSFSSEIGMEMWMPMLCFAAGLGLAITWFLGFPRPNWLYVLEHETAHALAVWMSGGRISRFKVSAQGGHVESDRLSCWIALAPYWIPLYPIVAGLLWMVILWWKPEWVQWTFIFLIVWGILWGFHGCFTASLLMTRQPDFESQGRLFSITSTLLINLWLANGLIFIWLRPFDLGEGLKLTCHLILEDALTVWKFWQIVLVPYFGLL